MKKNRPPAFIAGIILTLGVQWLAYYLLTLPAIDWAIGSGVTLSLWLNGWRIATRKDGSQAK